MTAPSTLCARHRGAVLGAALATLFALGSAPVVEAAVAVRRPLADGSRAVLTDGADIFLEAMPERNEGFLAFSRRLCGSSSLADEVQRANGGTSRLLRGVRYRVPLELLRSSLRDEVLAALFPGDLARPDGWAHEVRDGQQESLWQIAEWFTGRGEAFAEIRSHNGLLDEQIRPGQVLVVPASLLRQPFRGAVAAAAAAAPPPVTSGELTYTEDHDGEYAVYRLKEGEALYSSVVVRFTGRLFADDVNGLAMTIAERSGIDDVTDIPVGYQIKVPLDLLSPQFLPTAHPRRREYDANRTASSQFSNQVRTADLAGVTIILDAGHGGRDVGASRGGVWESVYVYDIMLRTRRVLMQRTAARVLATTRDGDGSDIQERDILAFSRQHHVLTSPPYTIEDARVGTNLRWYLANSIYDRMLKRGGGAEEAVFISLHADSLHPSLRGAMVYVPGLLPTKSDYGKSGVVYSSRKEVQEKPRVSFSKHQRVRSEGLSRELAEHVIASFARHRLAVHPNQPVRDRIVRKRGSAWVPAVLRYNGVPAKVLVEVCNLANSEDLRLIQTQTFRQQVAEAIVEGLLDYYGEESTPRAVATAAP